MTTLIKFHSIKLIFILKKLSLNQIVLENILWSKVKLYITTNIYGYITFDWRLYHKNHKNHIIKLWRNGNIMRDCFFINHLREECYKDYYDDGVSVFLECWYHKDLHHGPYKQWNQDGTVKQSLWYKNGILEESFTR